MIRFSMLWRMQRGGCRWNVRRNPNPYKKSRATEPTDPGFRLQGGLNVKCYMRLRVDRWSCQSHSDSEFEHSLTHIRCAVEKISSTVAGLKWLWSTRGVLSDINPYNASRDSGRTDHGFWTQWDANKSRAPDRKVHHCTSLIKATIDHFRT